VRLNPQVTVTAQPSIRGRMRPRYHSSEHGPIRKRELPVAQAGTRGHVLTRGCGQHGIDTSTIPPVGVAQRDAVVLNR
jgi:hypothetical protein